VCKGRGEARIESLKGGDGVKDNSSLWILRSSSSECDFIEGITKDRDSLFLIPILEDIIKEDEDSKYSLTFKGKLLIPCSISLYLINREDSDDIKKITDVRWVDEGEGVGRVEKIMIDGRRDEEVVLGCVIFKGEKESRR
jgi:hypothetical protein